MASAIICLADNQKFNFSKYIFDNMVKGLGGVKFDMFLRFLMRRIGAGFSGVNIPLFDTMMKKQKPKRKQRKEAEVSNDESEDEDNVPTPSSDPLPSGEDSFILNELMVFYTSLQEQKIGADRRVKSPMEKDGLGAQEDASKQERMIKEIDQNAKIALDDETQGRTNDDEMFGERMIEEIDQNVEIALDDKTQGRTNDDEMFGVDDLAGEEVVIDSVAPTIDVIEDGITMAQALAALKSVKPKVVKLQIPTVSSSKDKGKAKMIEPKVPLKKKDHMRIDEEYARKLQALSKRKGRFSKVQKARFEKEAQESSTIRTTEHLESDISKKQKVDDNVEPVVDDSKELRKCIEIVPDDGDEVDDNVELVVDDSKELRKCIEIVPDDGDEFLMMEMRCLLKLHQYLPDLQPSLTTKFTRKEKKTYFKIIRADGNSQVYQTFEKMFKNFNREDLEVLWAIVKDRFKKEKPVDDMDNILFRNLKTMFEHHVEDTI
nr:hypothetical protein [Tanacetum cinerariifolium]